MYRAILAGKHVLNGKLVVGFCEVGPLTRYKNSILIDVLFHVSGGAPKKLSISHVFGINVDLVLCEENNINFGPTNACVDHEHGSNHHLQS